MLEQKQLVCGAPSFAYQKLSSYTEEELKKILHKPSKRRETSNLFKRPAIPFVSHNKSTKNDSKCQLKLQAKPLRLDLKARLPESLPLNNNRPLDSHPKAYPQMSSLYFGQRPRKFTQTHPSYSILGQRKMNSFRNSSIFQDRTKGSSRPSSIYSSQSQQLPSLEPSSRSKSLFFSNNKQDLVNKIKSSFSIFQSKLQIKQLEKIVNIEQQSKQVGHKGSRYAVRALVKRHFSYAINYQPAKHKSALSSPLDRLLEGYRTPIPEFESVVESENDSSSETSKVKKQRPAVIFKSIVSIQDGKDRNNYRKKSSRRDSLKSVKSILRSSAFPDSQLSPLRQDRLSEKKESVLNNLAVSSPTNPRKSSHLKSIIKHAILDNQQRIMEANLAKQGASTGMVTAETSILGQKSMRDRFNSKQVSIRNKDNDVSSFSSDQASADSSSKESIDPPHPNLLKEKTLKTINFLSIANDSSGKKTSRYMPTRLLRKKTTPIRTTTSGQFNSFENSPKSRKRPKTNVVRNESKFTSTPTATKIEPVAIEPESNKTKDPGNQPSLHDNSLIQQNFSDSARKQQKGNQTGPGQLKRSKLKSQSQKKHKQETKNSKKQEELHSPDKTVRQEGNTQEENAQRQRKYLNERFSFSFFPKDKYLAQRRSQSAIQLGKAGSTVSQVDRNKIKEQLRTWHYRNSLILDGVIFRNQLREDIDMELRMPSIAGGMPKLDGLIDDLLTYTPQPHMPAIHIAKVLFLKELIQKYEVVWSVVQNNQKKIANEQSIRNQWMNDQVQSLEMQLQYQKQMNELLIQKGLSQIGWITRC